MTKNKTALEVNTSSDTSKSMEQKTDQIADSKLSDKDQDSLKDSDKGLDKTADNNKASDNGNGYMAEVNDSGKDITDTSDNSYMTDTEENDKKTVTDTAGDNNGADTDNGYTVDIETREINRKLSNIEKHNMRLTPEERKASAIQAGIRSGEVRRERKTLGEELKLILAQGDNQERLCMALFTAALGGNYKAFNSLRDTIGEMPTQKQEVTTNMTEGDRELLENVQKRLKEQNVTK